MNKQAHLSQTKDLYDLELFEIYEWEISRYYSYWITRVPGGWLIYESYQSGDGIKLEKPPVFVPYNDEFKPNQTNEKTPIALP